MAKWIEVPAHRILVVETPEFLDGFRTLDENGRECRGLSSFAIAERRSDGRVFRLAKFCPRKLPHECGDSSVYLVEI
jgi:hypothetical protein